MSVNKTTLINLQTELNMARAKRYNNMNAGLPLDLIDNRIEVLNAAIDRVKIEIEKEEQR